MNRINISIILVFILALLYPTTDASAHGWGYKKGSGKQVPEIGEYESILDPHLAFYVDTQTDKDIYLTFDNGYEAGYTDTVLNVLKKEDVPATFFVTGHYTEEEPALVKRMVDEGHIIGNHSYHHPDFTTMSKDEVDEELKMVEDAVASITNQQEMKYVRPPRGTFNKDTLKWTNELGYISVFWSLAFKDWETDKQKGSEYAYEQITNQIHPGAIILLHTVSEDNAEALEKVIQKLKEDGYKFKSLDNLLWKKLLSKDMLF